MFGFSKAQKGYIARLERDLYDTQKDRDTYRVELIHCEKDRIEIREYLDKEIAAHTETQRENDHLKLQVEDRSGFESRAGHFVSSRFGEACLQSVPERVDRFFEEACEFVQSENMDFRHAIEIAVSVFKRPVGEAMQELGGVMMTLFAYGNARNIDVLAAAEVEFDRAMAVPLAKIRARQAAKAALGLSMTVEHPVNPWSRGTYNLTQQVHLEAHWPDVAERMKAEAILETRAEAVIDAQFAA